MVSTTHRKENVFEEYYVQYHTHTRFWNNGDCAST